MKIFVLFLVFLPTSFGLHCLSQDHCGENGVCVTGRGGSTPKCMCLLGYRGNGANCIPTNSSETKKSAAIGIGKRQIVTIYKCDNNTVSPPPDQHHHGDHVPKQQENGDQIIDQQHGDQQQQNDQILDQKQQFLAVETNDLSESQFPIERKQIESEFCKEIICDFENGPCGYKNDKNSKWRLQEINSGSKQIQKRRGKVLLVLGQRIQNYNYLVSSSFFLSSPTALTFDYFMSKKNNKLTMSSNYTKNKIWNANPEQSGWNRGLVFLEPGKYRVIFSAGKMRIGDAIAVDNVLLYNLDGTPATCI